MFGSFGWMELLLILFIVLIIFGAGKIPQLGEGLGKAIKGFKKSVHEPDAIDVTPPPEAPVQQAQAASPQPGNSPGESSGPPPPTAQPAPAAQGEQARQG